MSLVNTMLRDLDRRRAAESERGAIPNEVRPLPESAGRGVGPVLSLAAVAAMGLGATGWWWATAAKNESVKTSASAAVATPPPAAQSVPPIPSIPPVAQVEPGTAAFATTEVVPPAVSGAVNESTSVALLPAARLAAARPNDPPLDTAAAESAPVNVKRRDAEPVTKAPSARAEPTAPQAASELSPVTPGRLKLAGALNMHPGAIAPRGAVPAVKSVEPPPRAAPTQDDDWRQAQGLLRDGHPEQAEPVLKRLVQAQPGNAGARNALLGILLPARRNAEAVEVLRDGLAHRPAETGWAINLARIHAVGNDYAASWEVLERSLPHAESNAEYRAFCGTVLQRLNRGGEAIMHYQAALKLNPREPRWWVGMGIALDSAARPAEAREAFQHAQALGGLSADLAAFVAQKLK